MLPFDSEKIIWALVVICALSLTISMTFIVNLVSISLIELSMQAKLVSLIDVGQAMKCRAPFLISSCLGNIILGRRQKAIQTYTRCKNISKVLSQARL